MRRIDKPLSYWQDIYNIYVTDNLSYEALSIKVGESVSTIRRRFKELDFGAKDKALIEQSRRTTCAKVFSDPDRLDEINKKKHATCIEKYGTTHPTKSEMVKNKTANTNLRKYGHGSVLQNEQVKEKIRQTNLKVYGVENPSQSEDIKKKKRETAYKNFGTYNPMQSDVVKQKSRITNLERYGETTPSKNEHIRKKIKETVWNRCNKAFKDLLKERSLTCTSDFKGYTEKVGDKSVWTRYDFTCTICSKDFNTGMSNRIQCPFCNNTGSRGQNFVGKHITDICNNVLYENRTIIPPQELDIYIPEKKIAFEYNGNYWHRHSRIGDAYHKEKTEICLEKGIKLYHIWEHEDPNKIKSLISTVLGQTQYKYDARKLTITPIDYSQRQQFFEANHLHNDTQATFSLALTDSENQVIQAISFRKNKGDLEIARFATKLNCQVRGGFSKLMKHSLNYIRENHSTINKIITYCDRDWTPDYQDSVYYKYGFTLVGDSGSMLKYYNNGQAFSRERFQKHKLKDMFEDYDDSNVNDFLETKRIYAFYNSGNWKFELNI